MALVIEGAKTKLVVSAGKHLHELTAPKPREPRLHGPDGGADAP